MSPLGSMPLSRRVMIAVLYEHDLVDLLSGTSKLHRRFKMPTDARILSVSADWVRNAILVLVHSETFDQVPEGAMPREMEQVQVTS
jgi:hypothetical protein